MPKSNSAGGNRLAVNEEVFFWEVPASWAHNDRRALAGILQLIGLALRAGEGERVAKRVPQVQLTGDHVRPERSISVLEVRKPDFGA